MPALRAPRGALALVWAACIGAAGVLGAQDTPARACTTAADAIEYKEFPEGGPMGDTGRRLTTHGDARWAVDVNSRIDVHVDTLCLRSMLAPAVTTPATARRAEELGGRLALLDEAARSIPDLMSRWQSALDAYRAAKAAGAPERASAQVDAYNELAGRVTQALHKAIEARLTDERSVRDSLGNRVPPAEASRHLISLQASALMSRMYPDTAPDGSDKERGYNYDVMRSLVTNEVTSARNGMAALPTPALAMAVRAYLRTRAGDAVPIYLVHYNNAAVGPDAPVTKVEVGVSPEQAAMLAQYQQMVASMHQARTAGEMAVEIVRAQYGVVRTQLDTTTAKLAAALGTVKVQVKALDTWRSPENRNRWAASVAATMTMVPAVRPQWESAAAIIDTMGADVDLVRKIADLRPALATADPATALTDILGVAASVQATTRQRAGLPVQPEVWAGRVTRLSALVTNISAALAGNAQVRQELERAPSPIADLAQLRDAAKALEAALRASPLAARDWLSSALGSDLAQAASELPDPPGQRRQLLGADAGTSIDLRTIPVKRSEGDRLEVRYDFFADDAPIAGGWRDELTLRSFGWLARSVAGIGFVRHIGGDPAFSPTATLSWLATHRGWPEGTATGLGGITRTWGLGLSTMSVNFDSAQKVQLGLALTGSLFDDRLLAGYGYNLQANTQPTFFFFSVRLFSATGSLGGQ